MSEWTEFNDEVEECVDCGKLVKELCPKDYKEIHLNDNLIRYVDGDFIMTHQVILGDKS